MTTFGNEATRCSGWNELPRLFEDSRHRTAWSCWPQPIGSGLGGIRLSRVQTMRFERCTTGMSGSGRSSGRSTYESRGRPSGGATGCQLRRRRQRKLGSAPLAYRKRSFCVRPRCGVGRSNSHGGQRGAQVVHPSNGRVLPQVAFKHLYSLFKRSSRCGTGATDDVHSLRRSVCFDHLREEVLDAVGTQVPTVIDDIGVGRSETIPASHLVQPVHVPTSLFCRTHRSSEGARSRKPLPVGVALAPAEETSAQRAE